MRRIAARRGGPSLLVLAFALAPLGCRSAGEAPAPGTRGAGGGAVEEAPAARRVGERLPRVGQEILVCGQLFHAGTKVVLWTDPYGYDAYRAEPRFGERRGDDAPEGQRYGTLRRHVDEAQRERVLERGWELDELREEVGQFVLHYDVCGTSRRCFEVLHDLRGLSVHFLLDVDGTIYQTLDLKERAWHAGTANDRSVGVEIANIGAYPEPDAEALQAFYARDEEGVRLVFPERLAAGAPPEDEVLRPARETLVEGEIHGRRLYQYDFTDAQYEALAHLCAALHRALPRIRLDAPRDASGAVRRDVLSEEELADFRGLIAHWHVTTRKVDPGPAFDWERVIRRAEELLAEGDAEGVSRTLRACDEIQDTGSQM